MFLRLLAVAFAASPLPDASRETAPAFDRIPEPSVANTKTLRARIVNERVDVTGPAFAWTWAIPSGADRLALREDGWVGFVAPVNGWPAVFVSPPGGPPRALTNVDLVAVPGEPPLGFVAPPRAEGDLRFDGDTLTWSNEAGLQRVGWSL